jgi:hypothetical protein
MEGVKLARIPFNPEAGGLLRRSGLDRELNLGEQNSCHRGRIVNSILVDGVLARIWKNTQL